MKMIDPSQALLLCSSTIIGYRMFDIRPADTAEVVRRQSNAEVVCGAP
jgi:hypothetical protein